MHGGKLRKADRTAADPSALFADLPTPMTPALAAPFNILVTGIGGTGVITIGALLGMAAHVQGLACSTLDFTGLSQKNGAVMSHVRIAPAADQLANVRIGPGTANLILGCDIVVATSIPALSRAEPRRHARGRQRRSAADRKLRHRPRHRLRSGRDA